MIRLKDLQNRDYSGKVCIRFEYVFYADDNNQIRAVFKRELNNHKIWTMTIVLDRTRDKDSEVYNFAYELPKDDAPLELTAAIGLKYFQLYLKEEIQMKSAMDFNLGEIIDGVVG